MPLWVVRGSDQVFLRDKGPEPEQAGQIVVTVDQIPDPVLERYDAGSPTGRRPASGAELSAGLTATKDARAEQLGDEVVALAVARVLWEETQKRTLKAGQTALTWTEFRTAVKALILARLNA